MSAPMEISGSDGSSHLALCGFVIGELSRLPRVAKGRACGLRIRRRARPLLPTMYAHRRTHIVVRTSSAENPLHPDSDDDEREAAPSSDLRARVLSTVEFRISGVMSSRGTQQGIPSMSPYV